MLVDSHYQSLKLLFVLRCAALLGQSLTIFFVHYIVQMTLPLMSLSMVIGTLVACNVYVAYILSQHRVVSSDTLAVQLGIDVMALALLCYFTGGVTNPFVSLFLLPLAIAAFVLPIAYIFALGGLTLFLYGSLLLDYVPLPTVPARWQSFININHLALWLNFVISSSLLIGFITYLAHQLRYKQSQLEQQQQSLARQEQVLALGTMAAGTAHELGTPLSTIAVLAHDLQNQVSQDLRPDMDLLCQQVNRCKQILKEMVQKVEQAQSQQLSLMTPQALITQVLDKFLLLRPSITVIHNIEQSDSQFYLASDATLEQAIINLLNNAADASPHHVSITLTQSTHKIQIDIADRGIGLPPEMMALVGQKSLSTKGEQGMGIGLLLANATLARLGGEIHFVNRVGGGVTASVLLPVHSSIK